jgi:hypothetical protein
LARARGRRQSARSRRFLRSRSARPYPLSISAQECPTAQSEVVRHNCREIPLCSIRGTPLMIRGSTTLAQAMHRAWTVVLFDGPGRIDPSGTANEHVTDRFAVAASRCTSYCTLRSPSPRAGTRSPNVCASRVCIQPGCRAAICKVRYASRSEITSCT